MTSRLAAILAADVAGYSRRIVPDEIIAQLKALAAESVELARQKLKPRQHPLPELETIFAKQMERKLKAEESKQIGGSQRTKLTTFRA